MYTFALVRPIHVFTVHVFKKKNFPKSGKYGRRAKIDFRPRPQKIFQKKLFLFFNFEKDFPFQILYFFLVVIADIRRAPENPLFVRTTRKDDVKTENSSIRKICAKNRRISVEKNAFRRRPFGVVTKT